MNAVEKPQKSYRLSKPAKRYLWLASVLTFAATSWAVSYIIRYLILDPVGNRISIGITSMIAGGFAALAVTVFGKFLNHILKERETS